MATTRAETAGSPGTGAAGGAYGGYPQGDTGWLLFAGIMIAAVGILNVMYGIAAIGNSSFFVGDARFILSDLNTWGWVMLVLGALQVAAALSIWAGGTYGRWFGIAVATFNSIGALLSIPAYPFWSLAIFAIDVLVIFGLTVYGGNRRVTE
jgi:hypothetical protein